MVSMEILSEVELYPETSNLALSDSISILVGGDILQHLKSCPCTGRREKRRALSMFCWRRWLEQRRGVQKGVHLWFVRCVYETAVVLKQMQQETEDGRIAERTLSNGRRIRGSFRVESGSLLA